MRILDDAAQDVPPKLRDWAKSKEEHLRDQAAQRAQASGVEMVSGEAPGPHDEGRKRARAAPPTLAPAARRAGAGAGGAGATSPLAQLPSRSGDPVETCVEEERAAAARRKREEKERKARAFLEQAEALAASWEDA